MNEGENSVVPNSPNFSSPNISTGNNEELTATVSAQETEKAITSEDISAMAGTTAGAVAVAAASMTESDAPEAVSSGAAITSNSSDDVASSRSRFGLSGRRFHANETKKSSAPVFAGAPDFFNQAASDIVINNPADQKKSKMPLFIGIGVVAAVIAIVIGIVLLAPKNNVADNGENIFDTFPDDLKSILSDENFDSAAEFEMSIRKWSSENTDSIWKIVNSGTITTIKNRFGNYCLVLSKLSNYNVSALNNAQKQAVEKIEKKINDMKPKYEAILDDYSLIFDYMKGNRSEAAAKIQASDSEKLKQLAKASDEMRNNYTANAALYVSQCTNVVSDACAALKQQRDNSEEFSEGKELFQGVINYRNGGNMISAEDQMYATVLEMKGLKK